jgi:hypothetical protein
MLSTIIPSVIDTDRSRKIIEWGAAEMIVTENGISIQVLLSDSATNADQIVVIINDGQCSLNLSAGLARTLAAEVIRATHLVEVKANLAKAQNESPVRLGLSSPVIAASRWARRRARLFGQSG